MDQSRKEVRIFLRSLTNTMKRCKLLAMFLTLVGCGIDSGRSKGEWGTIQVIESQERNPETPAKLPYVRSFQNRSVLCLLGEKGNVICLMLDARYAPKIKELPKGMIWNSDEREIASAVEGIKLTEDVRNYIDAKFSR